MNLRSWLRHGWQIARTERTRNRRQLDRSVLWRAVIAIGLAGVLIGGGIGAHTVGTGLRTGKVTLPIETLQAAAAAGFFALLVGFSQKTSRLMERLNTDHLLTTVSAHEVVLGVVLAVASQRVLRLSVAALCLAIGFAVGIRSPVSVLTICLAVAGFVTLAALLGVSFSLVMTLITTRSPRFRRYKNALAVMAFFLLAFLFPFSDDLLSVELLTGGFAVAPTAWFVDLGFLGTATVQSVVLRGAGAAGVTIVAIPVLLIVSTVLARRIWETEPVSSTTLHHSRSLVGDGLAERVFASHVSRPVLTVARKRWLQERRIPHGLSTVAFIVITPLPGVILPAVAAGEVPGISLVLLVVLLSVGSGLAVGFDPIGTEYSSLPMTLTSTTGTQFIRGALLAGVGIGAPATVMGTVLLAVWSPLGILETMLIVVAGISLCMCSLLLSAAVGMRVAYRDLFPAPLPLTSATIHTEIGRASFIRTGAILGALGIVCLPALGGYLLAFFDPGTVLGLPIAAVRVGSLVVTTILAVAISVVGYQRAVPLYNQYTLS